MTQLLAIAHVIKIIFIVICIITAYYWIKALIAAKRCDSVIDKFGREYRDGFFKIIEKIQTLDDIDDNKKFQYEINNALTLYKLLGCEKSDYVWTPDSISHLAAEAFEIKLLCICDKDIDKDNERGRQIKIILDNFNSLQDIIDKCDKYCSDKMHNFILFRKYYMMAENLNVLIIKSTFLEEASFIWKFRKKSRKNWMSRIRMVRRKRENICKEMKRLY